MGLTSITTGKYTCTEQWGRDKNLPAQNKKRMRDFFRDLVEMTSHYFCQDKKPNKTSPYERRNIFFQWFIYVLWEICSLFEFMHCWRKICVPKLVISIRIYSREKNGQKWEVREGKERGNIVKHYSECVLPHGTLLVQSKENLFK